MRLAELALFACAACAPAQAGDVASTFVLDPPPGESSFAIALDAADPALGAALTRLASQETLAPARLTSGVAQSGIVLAGEVEKTSFGARVTARVSGSADAPVRLQLSVMGRAQPGFAVTLLDTPPAFAPVTFERRDLSQLVVTRTATILRTRPSSSSLRRSRLPAGRLLEKVETRHGWIQVHGPGGRPQWLEEAHVQSLPCRVVVDWKRVLPRSSPGGRPLPPLNAMHRSYRVVDVRAATNALWYRLEGPGSWVPARDTQARSCFPAAGFAAAMAHWRRGEYPAAITAWERFLERHDAREHAAAAAAHVWIAASHMLTGNPGAALPHLDAAASIAPENTTVYRLRAVAKAVAQGHPRGSHADLREALRLAPAEAETRRLVDAFAALGDKSDHRYDLLRYLIRPAPDTREAFNELRAAATPG